TRSKRDWSSDVCSSDLKRNLAIGFLNYGVKKANEGELSNALDLFTRAFGIEAPEEFIALVRENIAAAHVRLGIQSHEKGDLENRSEERRVGKEGRGWWA